MAAVANAMNLRKADDMSHHLKTLPCYFQQTWCANKLFEVRDDRDHGFQKGDHIHLEEFIEPAKNRLGGSYTGRKIEAQITYVFGYGQPAGQVVFGFKIIKMQDGLDDK